MAARIDSEQRRLLEWLAEPDQLDHWVWIGVIPFEVCDNGNDVRSLKRRGLVEQDGRGRYASISISDAGLAAIGREPRA